MPLMRRSVPRLCLTAVVLLAAGVHAYPERWLTHASGAADGSCGQLISQAGQSGMGSHGYTYISDNDDTLELAGGVVTFVTPLGNEWFATATSGTFSGGGSFSGCAKFRYGNSGGTTVTWTPSGSLSGTAKLQVGYAAGYDTVNYYELTVSSGADSPPSLPPLPTLPPPVPTSPPPPRSPPSPPSPPLSPSSAPSPPHLPAGALPPSAPKTCTASSRVGYDCMVEPPGASQGYVLHWTVASADVRILAETTASDGCRCPRARHVAP